MIYKFLSGSFFDLEKIVIDMTADGWSIFHVSSQISKIHEPRKTSEGVMEEMNVDNTYYIIMFKIK